MKNDAKCGEELTFALKNDKRNLVNFKGSSWISKNLHFDRFLLSIAYKVSARKVQKSYLSWYWRVVQTSRKTGFFKKNSMRNLVNFIASIGKY